MDAMSPGVNGAAGRLEGARGDAGRGHHEDLERQRLADVEQPVDPVRPEHVGDLVRIETTAVVPCARTARANSSTISFDDSMCTCASM
jgi:hypothetical protein